MINVLFVGAGGFIGAVSRYGLMLGAARIIGNPTFPWGVLTVNVTGSLIAGILTAIGEERHIFSSEARLFLFLGVLGGFTTFSSITNDTLVLVRTGHYIAALGTVTLSVVLGLTAVAVGYVLTKAAA
jgi:fluoride exporter